MQLRKMLAMLCVLCVMCCPTVAADGGTVIYDESNGEKLQDLLNEDDGAWPTVALPETGELAIQAKGAVLMDLGSGTVLYEQDSHTRLPIASVTKVMTLLLVMEALEAGRIQWTDPVTCSSTAAGIGGSAETVAVRNLKNGLIRLRRELGLPATLAELGIDPGVLSQKADALVAATLADPCCATNPMKVEDFVVRRILEEVTGRV